MRVQPVARRASLFAVLLTLAACGSTGPDRPGPAALLSVVSGDAQSGTVTTTLANPLVVTVTDAQSRPVQGALVRWSITSGTGILTPTSSATDGNGTAKTSYTLGTLAGANQVTASVSGVTSSATFTATSLAGALYKVVAAQHALALCEPGDQGTPSASAADQFGNALDSTVTWISRNPSVATVTSTGTVQLVSATGATYVVASSGSAQPDSVYVTAAPPVTLAAGQVDDTLPSSAFCVQSNQLGSEYVLVAFFNTTSQGSATNIVVSGSRLRHHRIGREHRGAQPRARDADGAADDAAAPRLRVRVRPARTRSGARCRSTWSAARAWDARRRLQGPAFSTTTGAASATSTAPSFSSITSSTKVGDFVQLNTNANAYCTSPTMSTGPGGGHQQLGDRRGRHVQSGRWIHRCGVPEFRRGDGHAGGSGGHDRVRRPVRHRRHQRT